MTEEEKAAEVAKQAEESAKKEAFERAQASLKEKSTEDLIKIINDTSSEAKDYRLKKNELKAELDELLKEKKEREEAKLKDDGELQKLIDAKEAEINDKDSELSKLRVKADEFEQFKLSKIESAKAKLGDKWLDEYGSLSLSGLDKLVESMAGVKTEPKGDSGANGDLVKITLTAEQKNEAYARYPFVEKPKAEEYYKHNLITTGKITEKK